MDEVRRKQHKKRYGWLLLFTILNWLAIAYVVFFVDPEAIRDFIFPGSYLPMVLLMFGGIFWILAILLLSARKALRWTAGITMFLLLRLLQLGTTMNGLLILGLLLSWEVYQYKTKKEIDGKDVDKND